MIDSVIICGEFPGQAGYRALFGSPTSQHHPFFFDVIKAAGHCCGSAEIVREEPPFYHYTTLDRFLKMSRVSVIRHVGRPRQRYDHAHTNYWQTVTADWNRFLSDSRGAKLHYKALDESDHLVVVEITDAEKYNKFLGVH